MFSQVQDYLELIRDQILSQVKSLTRRPTRSLSVGAHKERRDLVDFKTNQNAFISFFNLILDNYIRVRYAFIAIDEIWMYLLEMCYPLVQLS